MRVILQRKMMLVVWLAMVMSLLPCAAQSTISITSGIHTRNVGSVTFNKLNNTTIITVQWIRGFKVENLELDQKLPILNSASATGKDDLYYFYEYTINSSYSRTSCKADISFDNITDPQDLACIFNYYTEDAATVADNVVVVSENVRGPGNDTTETPGILSFTSPIQIKLNPNMDIENFNIEVNGGNLYIEAENSIRNTSTIPNITLNSGQLILTGGNMEELTMQNNSELTLNGYAYVNTLTMKGGKFTANAEYASNVIDSVIVESGTIVFNPHAEHRRDYITNLVIKGDVNITGNNIFTDEDFDGAYFAISTVIEDGKVDMDKINLKSLLINNGNVTLTKGAYCNSLSSNDFQVQQKGGTFTMNECYVAGNITIEDGNFSMNKGCFYAPIEISGENVAVEIKGAWINNTILHKNGTLNISDARANLVVTENGILNISNTYISGGNYNGINDVSLQILGSTDVTLKDTYFDAHMQDGRIYIAPEVSTKPEDLVADGYGIYSFDEMIQPDIKLPAGYIDYSTSLYGKQDNYYRIPQVKKMSEGDTNSCWEAAKEASVGLVGIDAIAIPSKEEPGYYNFEIYTEKGLAWFAMKYIYEYNDHNEYCTPLTGFKEYPMGWETTVKLMNDLDMSTYDWIPFYFDRGTFDGQGHIIRNLNVKGSNVAFLYQNYGTLANLTVSGMFQSVQTIYLPKNNNCLHAAGLVISNGGNIINCGVEQSTISCQSTDYNAIVGGLIAFNGDSIQNSYMTGTVSCQIEEAKKWEINERRGRTIYIGGLIGEDSYGTASNNYFVGKLTTPSSVTQDHGFYKVDVKQDELVAYNPNGSELKDCTTNPNLDELNENVENHITEGNKISWRKWKTQHDRNDNYPIHDWGDDPSVIVSKFTLLKEGEGEFKGTYTYLEDEAGPESSKTGTIYADTTYTVVHTERFSLTATPAEGYELDRVVKILNGEEKDTLDMKVGEPLAYNVVVADTLKAYFKPIEIIPEPEPEVITTDSVLTATQVNGKDLVVDNDKEEYLELEASGIAVPSLTINAGSSAVLELSGTNDLGTVTNNGTLIVQNVNGSLNATIQNNGTFTDYTGKVTEVEGNASLSIEPITDNANDGETVTLVATAIADGTVSFQWQRQEDDGSWTNIEQAELMTRAMMLRAASEQTDELIVPLSEAGWYRCLITYNKGNTSTTLVAYAEVSDDGDVEEPENPEEDNPNLPDSPDYYNIYIETCEGVEATLSTTIVREGNSMTFTLETEEGYTDENMTVKFKQSMFGYWETITPNEKGVYLIRNIYADIYITVDGVEEENPTGIEEIGGIKVYAKDGSIYVQTPKQEQVLIISISGAIVKNEKQIGLQRYDGLQRGVYVVKVGKQVFKIRN